MSEDDAGATGVARWQRQFMMTMVGDVTRSVCRRRWSLGMPQLCEAFGGSNDGCRPRPRQHQPWRILHAPNGCAGRELRIQKSLQSKKKIIVLGPPGGPLGVMLLTAVGVGNRGEWGTPQPRTTPKKFDRQHLPETNTEISSKGNTVLFFLLKNQKSGFLYSAVV